MGKSGGIQTTAEIDKFMSLVDDKVFCCTTPTCLGIPKGRRADAGDLEKYLLPRIKLRVHLKDVRPSVIEQVRREGLSFLYGVKKGTFTVPGRWRDRLPSGVQTAGRAWL